MQWFLSDPDSGHIDFQSHCLALAIAKKTLDENLFKHAQKMINCTPSNLKVSNRVFLKGRQPGKWDQKWWACYRIVCMECSRHYLQIENQATGKSRPCNVKDIVHELPVDLWNVDTMLDRAGKFRNSSHKSPHYSPKYNLGNITYTKTMLLIKPPFFSLLCIGTLAEKDTLCCEPVLFHPFLKAYPTHHSWIITAHISVGNLDRQLCIFNWQKTLAHQLLVELQDQPLASPLIVNAQQCGYSKLIQKTHNLKEAHYLS